MHPYNLQGVSGLDADSAERKTGQFFEWLSLALAPTLCGSKPSTILSLRDVRHLALLSIWRECGCATLQTTALRFKILRRLPSLETVLFYRSDLLEQCLADDHHRWFLSSQGYPVNEGVESCLAVLQERFRDCCPHEIGLLLGIPLKDVLGFMAMTDLPLTCRGEWCVYGDPAVSLAAMQRFEDDRSSVACLLSSGMSPYEIIREKASDLHIA
ncbi:MAG TPA: DUF3793 family protein [Selenomonadales bacterium]|nr:DUF3793 family protein [Selenomonadales bacterium]